VCKIKTKGVDNMKKKKEQPICPKCNSKNIMARIKTDELYCRRCGWVGKKKEFYKKEVTDNAKNNMP
jgi:ribosomal protein S27AE